MSFALSSLRSQPTLPMLPMHLPPFRWAKCLSPPECSSPLRYHGPLFGLIMSVRQRIIPLFGLIVSVLTSSTFRLSARIFHFYNVRQRIIPLLGLIHFSRCPSTHSTCRMSNFTFRLSAHRFHLQDFRQHIPTTDSWFRVVLIPLDSMIGNICWLRSRISRSRCCMGVEVAVENDQEIL